MRVFPRAVSTLLPTTRFVELGARAPAAPPAPFDCPEERGQFTSHAVWETPNMLLRMWWQSHRFGRVFR